MKQERGIGAGRAECMNLKGERSMIISASRRTDIPTHYSQWLINRIREGYVIVRNPMNPRQVSRISLSPDVVDGIVFWTKNPLPMMERLDELRDYMYIFQFTLNAYGRDVEPNVPHKSKVMIPVFQRLSDAIGPERVLWRYDPILLSDTYTMEHHVRCFEVMARRLEGYTKRCTISFLDSYRSMEKNARALGLQPLTQERQEALAQALAPIARHHGLEIVTCAEAGDFSRYGIGHGSCIDRALFEHLLGCPLAAGRDKGQRPACGCMESIDIGAYNTCGNGCLYCYANHSQSAVRANLAAHDPASPLLCSTLASNDVIAERRIYSIRMKRG